MPVLELKSSAGDDGLQFDSRTPLIERFSCARHSLIEKKDTKAFPVLIILQDF